MSAESFVSVKKRELWIDNAKAIAMILIILGHTSDELTGLIRFDFVYGIHLVVFFVLSGYTVKDMPLSLDYVRKKFTRLMVPYFICCFAVLCMDIFNEFFIYGERSLVGITEHISKDIARSFFASGGYTSFGEIDIGNRIGAIWFLPALFFALVIFQLIVATIRNNKVMGLVCAAVSICGYITARFVWLPFSIQSGLFAVFFLWIGYSVSKTGILLRIKWYVYIIAFLFLAGGIHFGYCLINFVIADMTDLFLSPVIGLCGCLLVYLIAKHTTKVKFLNWIGKNSLSVLCVHLFALETMGVYFDKVLNLLNLDGQLRGWVKIILELVFAILGAYLMLMLKNKLLCPFENKIKDKISGKNNKRTRDITVDITRGILIISMLVGHFAIGRSLRSIIYSCHMVAFVFLSGYFYKRSEHLLRSVLNVMKTFLIPYVICFVADVIIHFRLWSGSYFSEVIQRYIFGMSFSGKQFLGIASVGSVYFILMLFVVRLLYMIIDNFIRNDIYKWVIILIFAALGVWLGVQDIWLPWSVDISLYSLIFYQLGVSFKKYRILDVLTRNSWVYFIISPVWAYMIWNGSMEIATRAYKPYGIVVIGALAGIILVYSFSEYIKNSLALISGCLAFIGKTSIIIIVIHVLLNSIINDFLERVVSSDGFAHMFLSIAVQIVIAVVIQLLLDMCRKVTGKQRGNALSNG